MPRRWRAAGEWQERTYYSVCESFRDAEGRPRHRTIEKLGTDPTPAAAAAAWRRIEADRREVLDDRTTRAESAEARAAELQRERERLGSFAHPSLARDIYWINREVEALRRGVEIWKRQTARAAAKAEHLDSLQDQIDESAARSTHTRIGQ